jgi:hypothetical protein
MKTEKRYVVLVVLSVVFVIMACCGGAVSGLYFAWMIAPVEWAEMTPYALAEPYQKDYLQMAIDSYAFNDDCALAVQRYKALGEAGPGVLEVIFDNPHTQDAGAISAFAQCLKK